MFFRNRQNAKIQMAALFIVIFLVQEAEVWSESSPREITGEWKEVVSN
jgi:hypothetical protein